MLVEPTIHKNKQAIAYYNEFDPFAAQWLKNLIHTGHIAPGDVDERSIEEVKPSELAGYSQCHFFAGIGGWSLALRLAGWDDSRPVWTGSCPCQPYSTAGSGKGKEDPRHLYPVWDRLITECKPPVVFGEQVAAAITKGWLDDVYQGLEQKGYAIGSAVLPACSVGTPHRRERLWFVADTSEQGLQERTREEMVRSEAQSESERCSSDGSLGYTEHNGRDGCKESESNGEAVLSSQSGENCTSQSEGAGSSRTVPNSTMANTECQRQSGSGQMGESLHSAESGNGQTDRTFDVGSRLWDNYIWHICGDGKARPVEPSIPLLAHGVSGRMVARRTGQQGGTEIQGENWYSRVGALKGFGNAIVPQVAAEFIKAYMECRP